MSDLTRQAGETSVHFRLEQSTHSLALFALPLVPVLRNGRPQLLHLSSVWKSQRAVHIRRARAKAQQAIRDDGVVGDP